MSFLRRLLGGDRGGQPPEETPTSTIDDRTSAEEDERDRDRELLRGEQERLDELQQRQLRYATYAWEPPAQGGERRADDADAESGSGSS